MNAYICNYRIFFSSHAVFLDQVVSAVE